MLVYPVWPERPYSKRDLLISARCLEGCSGQIPPAIEGRMKPLHCPLCGEEAMADQIQRDLYNVVCLECGAQSVVIVGDQLITPNAVPGKAA